MVLPENICKMIEVRSGMDVSIMGNVAQRSVIERRVMELNLTSVYDYFKIVESSPSELDNLIKGLLVSETWFFRDIVPFTLLTECVRQKLLDKKIIRILSLPCATGEEAYSIAITLKKESFLRENFEIVGMDINENCLVAAKKGVFKQKAFRKVESNIIQSYFSQIDKGIYLVNEEIRNEWIRFEKGNILDLFSTSKEGTFDIIFMRNLLIYFTLESRKRALANIEKLLDSDGVLFLVHADNIMDISNSFKNYGDPAAFAYVRVKKEEREEKRVEVKSELPQLDESYEKWQKVKDYIKQVLSSRK